MTKIQAKWRESKIDLSKLNLKTIREYKVISYPPAGNDVFDCIGTLNSGESIKFILKSERGTFANFDNEIKVLKTIKNFPVPKVIETGKVDNFTYIVMNKMDGEKLSDLFEKNKNIDRAKYLFLYGQELAKIHKIKLNWSIAKQRDINDIPTSSVYKNLDKVGSIFLDYRNNIDLDSKILIYGHNSKNIETDFKKLENFLDLDFFNNLDNRKIILESNNKISYYKIASVVITVSDFQHMKLTFTKDEWKKHIDWLNKSSLYQSFLDYDDQILIMQTCYYEPDDSYLLIVAQKIEEELY